jgi:hypothetical protein
MTGKVKALNFSLFSNKEIPMAVLLAVGISLLFIDVNLLDILW